MTVKGAIYITGASTGIGEDAAIALARMGYHVFAGVRKMADGERVAANVPGMIEPLYLDLLKPETIDEVTAHITRRLPELGLRGLYGLFNNAGIAVAGPLEFLPLEAFRRQMEVNVTAVVAVTQGMMPLLRQVPGSRIVITGSMSGKLAAPLMGAYSASKFAIEGLTDSLRRELIPFGIKVSLIEPGQIKTGIWSKSLDASAEMERELPKAAWDFYGKLINTLKGVAKHADKHAAPVGLVTKAVVHAFTAPKPKIRYVVGKDAKQGNFAVNWLSDGTLDKIVLNRIEKMI